MADMFNLDIYLHPIELFDISQSPDESINVFKELQKARRCFVLENDLHIIYLVVPIYAAMSWPQLDWMKYLDLWASLPPDIKRVGELVGVEERFLVRAMRGGVNMQSQANVRLFKHIYDPFILVRCHQAMQLPNTHPKHFLGTPPPGPPSVLHGSGLSRVGERDSSVHRMHEVRGGQGEPSEPPAVFFHLRRDGHLLLRQARMAQPRTSHKVESY